MKLGKYQFQHEKITVNGVEVILPKMPKSGKDLEKKKQLANQYRTAILGKLEPQTTSLRIRSKTFPTP